MESLSVRPQEIGRKGNKPRVIVDDDKQESSKDLAPLDGMQIRARGKVRHPRMQSGGWVFGLRAVLPGGSVVFLTPCPKCE
jgi:hypothetical protein